MKEDIHTSEIIHLSSPSKVSMSDEWFELADVDHFWIEWRFRVLKNTLNQYLSKEIKILEIGCGNGLVMWQLENEMGIIIDGCDLNPYALKNRKDVSGKVFLYDIFDLNPNLMEKYDIVLLLDVIEHIDDDIMFLTAAKKHLKPGGHLIIGVPAHRSLFSIYDKLIGHKRRYGKKQISTLFDAIGLKDKDIQFWGFSLLPLVIARKFYLNLIDNSEIIKSGFKPPHPIINWFIKIVMKIETSIFKKVGIGISIMAIGKNKI